MDFNLPKIEEKTLKSWKKNRIFEKSVKSRARSRDFVFYEGPPTANGRPGIHHVLARIFKDIICRYQTMKGFRVLRKAGWDTHGLPVELEVEKQLGLKSKKEIEEYGIAKFNKKCKESVWKYKEEWEKLTERIGFWLDMKSPYVTYDSNYIESVWQIIKILFDRGLVYQDYKVVPYCPRCQTTLSSHEVAQGYKKVKDRSVYVKFSVKGEPNSYFLVWTTTPWTLPANVAIAVNPNIDYVKVRMGKEVYYLSETASKALISADTKNPGELLGAMRGKDLVNKEYEPLYPFVKPDKKAYFVIAADFVSTDEGTGLVHIAPAFGEDDMSAGRKNDLPVLMTVDEEGKFKGEVKDWAGMFVKTADPLIIEDLKKRNVLFGEELYDHDYPFCWRCSSPLLYYAKKSWFIKMAKVKNDLISNNQKINWVPAHLKAGRFGEWLADVKDWAISRERYWGTPLPIWQCKECKKQVCLGSKEEILKMAPGAVLEDLHKPFIDKVVFKCGCKGAMRRVPEVLDCWFDSGAMPFAQNHWPFNQAKNAKQKPPDLFPADYISEAIDQTRGWFYTLLAISTLLGFGSPYRNVISLGHVLDEKGEKMSKSKGNVVDPFLMVQKYGADAIRWYFYTINQPGEPKLFAEKDINEALKRFVLIFWNSFIFYKTYVKEKQPPKYYKALRRSGLKGLGALDRWILSRTHNLITDITKKLDDFNVVQAARSLEEFTVNDLSQWYIRRSRKRFQRQDDKKDSSRAARVLGYVLFEVSLMLAPFLPFLSEEVYGEIQKGDASLHLSDWPKSNKALIDKDLESKMEEARQAIKAALFERSKFGIKVRQPLAKLKIKNLRLKSDKDVLELIKDEANIKEIVFDSTIKQEVVLDTNITEALKEEGLVREIVRNIQELRKSAKLKPEDAVSAVFSSSEMEGLLAKNKKFVLKEAKLKDFSFVKSGKQKFTAEKTAKVDGKDLWLALKKISWHS